MKIRSLICTATVLLLTACSDKEPPAILGHSDADNRIVWSWTAPTTGTPVASYIMFVDWKLADDYYVFGITNAYHGITRIEGDAVRVKVAGIDANGTQGPFSIWAEDFSTHTKPKEHQDLDRNSKSQSQ